MTQTSNPWDIQGTLTFAKTPKGNRTVQYTPRGWLLEGLKPGSPYTVAPTFADALQMTKANPDQIFGALSIFRRQDGAYVGATMFENGQWHPHAPQDPARFDEHLPMPGASLDLDVIAGTLSAGVPPLEISEVQELGGVWGVPLTDPQGDVVALAVVRCPEQAMTELAPPPYLWAGTQPLVMALHQRTQLVLRCVVVQDGQLRLYPGDTPIDGPGLFPAIQQRLGLPLLPDVERRWDLAAHLRTHAPAAL